jgi:single-strand DNA-binding protein
LNCITLTGRVGQDPEVRFTPAGTAVAKFSIADDYKVKGEKKTNWWTVIAWGELATKVVEPYVKKGNTVSIVGEGKFNSWEKDGQKHTSLEVTISKLMLVSSPAPRAAAGNDPADDIPF